MDDEVEEKEGAYEAIEKEIEATLAELNDDNTLTSFRDEYEKLSMALTKSHENERRLIKKCRKLNSEIQQHSSKVQTTLKLSQEDKMTIESLKVNIDRNWRMVDACLEKEKQNKGHITKLKEEIGVLNVKLDQGASMSKKQEMEIMQLNQQKEALLKERDMAKGSVDQMTNVSQEAHKKYLKLQKELEKAMESICTMKEKLSNKKIEKQQEQKRKEDLDEELKEIRLELEHLNEDANQKKQKIKQEHDQIKELEEHIKDLDNQEKAAEEEHRSLIEEEKNCKNRFEIESERNKRSEEEIQEKVRQGVQKKKEIVKIKKETEKTKKLLDGIKKRITAIEQGRKNLEKERGDLKTTVKDEGEIGMKAKKETETDKKKIEDLLRERDVLNKNIIKADIRTKKEIDMIRQAETFCHNLKKDVQRWKLDAMEYKKAIFNLEKQREKYGIELSIANSKHFTALEDLKKRETRLAELMKETAEVQSKLNQQKNLYDAVCTDRNLYSKNLIESNEEISEMKKKFKIMYHQIEQLKEEIKEKDSNLIKEHFNHHKVMKSNDGIQEKIDKAKKKVKSMTSITQTQLQEVKKVEATIQEAELEKANQQKELDGVIGERDILTTQLIRRNEELALLYERIKIQRSNINKGHVSYQNLLKQIASDETKVASVKKDLTAARGQITHITSMRREVVSLAKQVLQEESRKQALVQELSNPLNVHRWRKVEGSDPQTFELLQKVKQLQERLIQKSEEVVEKDMLIQEKEKLYVQLKNILARQPGPEVSQQLSWYTENLKEKTKQMKRMSKDLREYHTQVQNYKNDIDAYHGELRHMKESYYQRCREQEMGGGPMASGVPGMSPMEMYMQAAAQDRQASIQEGQEPME